MISISMRLYCRDYDRTTHVSVGTADAPSLIWRKRNKEPIEVREILATVEMERRTSGSIAKWIRDNIKLIDGIPVLPGCKIVVLEDSARKEKSNER